jgi:hypothetical protein
MSADDPITMSERIEEVTAPSLPEGERARTRASLYRMVSNAFDSSEGIKDLERVFVIFSEGALARISVVLSEMAIDARARSYEEGRIAGKKESYDPT